MAEKWPTNITCLLLTPTFVRYDEPAQGWHVDAPRHPEHQQHPESESSTLRLAELPPVRHHYRDAATDPGRITTRQMEESIVPRQGLSVP